MDQHHHMDSHSQSHSTSNATSHHHSHHHSSSHTVPRPRSPTPDSCSPPFPPLTRVVANSERPGPRRPAPCPTFPPCASSSRPTRPDPSWWNREAAGIPMSPRPHPHPPTGTTTGTGRATAATAPNTSARRRVINHAHSQDHPQQQQHAPAAPAATTSRTPSWAAPGTLMHDITLHAQTHRAAVAEAVRLDNLEKREREGRLRQRQHQHQQQVLYQQRRQRRSRYQAQMRRFDGGDEEAEADGEGEGEGLGSVLRRLWRCVKGRYGPASWREEERRRKWMEKGKGVAEQDDGQREGDEYVDVWEEKWLFDDRDTGTW